MNPSSGRWSVAGNHERVRAVLRERAEDFRVIEVLEPGSEGDAGHVWMRTRKESLSTPATARRIADALGINVSDVGFAGLKDERSISEQWFSVPAAKFVGSSLQSIDGVVLLEHLPQARKLRRGTHLGNRFEILLRGVDRPISIPDPCFFPNYFGQRRFGKDNMDQARHWLENRRQRRITPFKRGIYLSVLRAFLFNEVLGRRVQAGFWNTALEGDVLDSDGHPTGPLWGRGSSRATGIARDIEIESLVEHGELCEGLEYAGVDQSRRSLIGKASEVQAIEVAPDRLKISFFLPVGTYATIALDEYFQLEDHASS